MVYRCLFLSDITIKQNSEFEITVGLKKSLLTMIKGRVSTEVQSSQMSLPSIGINMIVGTIG